MVRGSPFHRHRGSIGGEAGGEQLSRQRRERGEAHVHDERRVEVRAGDGEVHGVGDRVGVLEDNTFESVDFFCGTAAANVVRVPLYPRNSREAHVHMLSHTDCRALVVSASHATAVEGIAEGVNVWHEKFGKGKVLRVEGASPNEKATVFFPKAGQKQLLLKFAKLEIINP